MGLKKALLAVTVALISVAAMPASASAAEDTAALGNVSAKMTYDTLPNGTGFRNVRLIIARNGANVLDIAADSTCTQCLLSPAYGGQKPSVSVLQLDANPEPEVVFDLFTGGAHCCFTSMIYRFDAAGNVLGLRHDFLDQGYMFADLTGDGFSEFKSVDGRFAYRFGSFADSEYPPQIWQFQNGAMNDITKQFPALIRQDLAGKKRFYKRRKGKGITKPVLAAIAGDQCLLGNCAPGLNLARKAEGTRFGRALAKFLTQLGYR